MAKRPGRRTLQKTPKSSPTRRRASAKSPRKPVVLVIVIITDPALVEEIVTGMIDLGVDGTLVEAKGLTALLREEMPIFSGLAQMLPVPSASRVLLAATTEPMAERVIELLQWRGGVGGRRPIGLVLPLSRTVGLREG